MLLQESGEMYLETILLLSKKLAVVRSIDVSEQMGYSKPSVSRAIGLLKSGGYVVTDENDFLILTDAGREIAERIYARHETFAQFLMKLGVSEKTAYEDACKIEHDVSDESFAKVCEFMEKWKKAHG